MGLLDDDSAAQYGNLFGGAGNQMLAPFVGPQGMEAARDNSLMSMGAAMMQASGKSFDPSHSSFLSSLGAGLNAGQGAYQTGMQRGIANAGAAMNLAKNRWLFNLLRGATGGAEPGSTAPAGSTPSPTSGNGTVTAYAPTAGLPGSTPLVPASGAGGGTAPTTMNAPAGSGAGGPAGDALSPGGSLNPLGVPRSTAAIGLAMAPDKYLAAQLGAYAPTDIMKTLRAQGIPEGSPQWNAALSSQVARDTAPQITRLSNGSYVKNGSFVGVPNAEGILTTPGATDAQGNPTNFSMSAVPGAAAAQAELSQAKASGGATFKTVQTYNPTTKQYEATPQTINAQRAGAYTPPSPTSNMPAPMRNNNPGALMQPDGKTLQSFPSMQAGVAAMDDNLVRNYGNKGIDTISGIITKYSPPNGKGNTPETTQNYITHVSQQMGLPPDAHLNMNDPATRQQLMAAMINHENGRADAAAASGVVPANAPATGPMPTSPPLGTTERENQAQGAAAENMQKDLKTSADFMRTASAQIQALQKMREIAARKTIFSSGPLGNTDIAQENPLNPAAAEYEKQRSNYLTVAGATGTDAQRAQAAHSLPDYGKPREALLQGIDTQIAQTRQQMLRANYLNEVGNIKGDASAYTQMANGFDQHVTPDVANVLAMPPGAAQKSAYGALIKQHPELKPNFQWALDNGMLK